MAACVGFIQASAVSKLLGISLEKQTVNLVCFVLVLKLCGGSVRLDHRASSSKARLI